MLVNIRTLKNWKLLTNHDHSYAELYDVAGDPFEKADLSEQRSEVVAQLQQKLKGWQKTLPLRPTGDVFSAERSVTERAN